jgi:hypothetical protein
MPDVLEFFEESPVGALREKLDVFAEARSVHDIKPD